MTHQYTPKCLRCVTGPRPEIIKIKPDIAYVVYPDGSEGIIRREGGNWRFTLEDWRDYVDIDLNREWTNC